MQRTPFGLDAGGRLLRGPSAGADAPLALRSPVFSGAAAGKWCSYATPGDQPVDQRIDDGAGLVFDTPPLDAALEIAGDAVLELDVSADRPVAQVAARLVDVAPDGAATRVSYGVLNLTHRDGHEAPGPLVPGQRYRVRVPLKPVAQTFRTGHRIRLGLSSTYFPLIWPAPEPVTLTIHPGNSTLELPVRDPSKDNAVHPFPAPEWAAPLEVDRIGSANAGWRTVNDLASGETALEVTDGAGIYRLVQAGTTVTKKATERYSVRHDDLASVAGTTVWEMALSRSDWRIRSLTETELTATETDFRIAARLRAWEGDALVLDRQWHESIGRDMC